VPAVPAIKLANAKATQDPRFQQAMDKLEKSAGHTKQHPPAARKAAEAQAAALPPPNEKLAGAKANTVDAMQEAETKKPEPGSFLTLLRAEIQKVMPKKVEDTKDYMKGEDRQQLKSAMTGNVNQQKAAATGDLKTTASQPPDTSRVPGKEVARLPAAPAPASPPPVGAAQAMPAPASEANVSLQQSKRDADKMLTDARVTPQQLQQANDPRFSAVLSTKAAVEKNADAAPQAYRASEQKILADAAAKATTDERQGLAAFVGVNGRTAAAVQLRQLTAKEKDEAERKRVTDHIEGIFNRTKSAVDRKLESLETQVSTLFDQGADAAVTKMRDYVGKRFDDRYSGLGGKALWLRDKFLPLPREVKAWFDEAHKVFLAELDALVVRVANLVESSLKEAKDEITEGQKEIRDYVQSLPAHLQAVGKAAEHEMKGRFDELRQGVDDKKNDLAQKLAQRYQEASQKGDAALKELKDKHKSLTEKLREAVGEVLKILTEFKNKLIAMLKKGEATIMLIVAHPIDFLKNLLSAIKKGFNQFVSRIWEHLKAGFLGWLFGTLANAGVQVPKDLSLPSILQLVLQVLGLTYDRIRAKAVKLIGERNVMLFEKVWGVISTLLKGGPAALWEQIKEYLANLKEMIVDAIQSWVITTVIKAAVSKLLSLFNPVGAIIQAILAIYNTVMFFIERINQILALVEAIISSVHSIATGAIDAAANWIEQTLARTIPVIISFLARLLGLSGISEKIQSVIQKIQSKVDQAVDRLIEKIKKSLGSLFGKKDQKPDERTEGQKKADLDKAVAEGDALLLAKGASVDKVKKKLPAIKSKYKMTSLEIVVVSEAKDKEIAHIHGVINPTKDSPDETIEAEGSIYVNKLTLELKPEFQGKVIRDKFYKKKFRKKPRAAVLAAAQAGPETYRCQNTGPKGPNHTDIITSAELTIEHTTPVVEHWNSTGNNQIQSERNSWYDDESHLVVFCRSCNLSDQEGEPAAKYLPKVTLRFRGPNDNPPTG